MSELLITTLITIYLQTIRLREEKEAKAKIEEEKERKAKEKAEKLAAKAAEGFKK